MINLNEFEDMVTFKQEDEDGNIALDRGDVLELIERLRQAEKDAARYQWLLDNCTTQQADSCGPIFVMTIRRNKNQNNVGLSIDEAMNDLMDEKVRCPYCESEFDDFTAEADFIGWHGMCAKCFLSEESND